MGQGEKAVYCTREKPRFSVLVSVKMEEGAGRGGGQIGLGRGRISGTAMHATRAIVHSTA